MAIIISYILHRRTAGHADTNYIPNYSWLVPCDGDSPKKGLYALLIASFEKDERKERNRDNRTRKRI